MSVHVVVILYFAGAALAAPSASRFDDDERDSRGMTWSNYLPGGGLTFWSSATDDFWTPESDQRRHLPQNAEFDFHGADHWPSDGKPLSPGAALGGEKEQPTTSHDVPPTNSRPFDDDRERRPLKPSKGSWPGKKDHSDSDDEDDRKYSGANASVNAWFPIMLGMMPPPEGKTSTDKIAKDEDSDNADDLPPRSITVVANSVNHASRGRANAHSVLFAGADPSSSFRRFGRSMILVR